ncbi:MAG: ATP-binding cassette domain-containing protein [Bacillota bacterium]
MDNILNATGLRKAFGSRVAVDDLSFAIPAGTILGLLGPNGAGKTTAVRMVMGILAPDAGQVTFYRHGRPALMDKSRIGYLPEERGLYDDAKVMDTLVYLGVLKGMPGYEAAREARRWLERMGLEGRADQKVEKLSKGMQQKVQFVASVLHRPDLLMLDEPFSGLDPVNQDLFRGIIRELQQSGMSILLSAHQMNLVEELCDSIILINQGRKVLGGRVQEIKDSYAEHIIEVRYAGSDHTMFSRLPATRLVKREPGRVVLRYRGQELSSLLGQLASEVPVIELSAKKPSLHAIFIEAVGGNGDEAV